MKTWTLPARLDEQEGVRMESSDRLDPPDWLHAETVALTEGRAQSVET